MGKDLALLWPWHRPAATDWIQPLAWEPPYAVSAALKQQQQQKDIKASSSLRQLFSYC